MYHVLAEKDDDDQEEAAAAAIPGKTYVRLKTVPCFRYRTVEPHSTKTSRPRVAATHAVASEWLLHLRIVDHRRYERQVTIDTSMTRKPHHVRAFLHRALQLKPAVKLRLWTPDGTAVSRWDISSLQSVAAQHDNTFVSQRSLLFRTKPPTESPTRSAARTDGCRDSKHAERVIVIGTDAAQFVPFCPWRHLKDTTSMSSFGPRGQGMSTSIYRPANVVARGHWRRKRSHRLATTTATSWASPYRQRYIDANGQRRRSARNCDSLILKCTHPRTEVLRCTPPRERPPPPKNRRERLERRREAQMAWDRKQRELDEIRARYLGSGFRAYRAASSSWVSVIVIIVVVVFFSVSYGGSSGQCGKRSWRRRNHRLFQPRAHNH